MTTDDAWKIELYHAITEWDDLVQSLVRNHMDAEDIRQEKWLSISQQMDSNNLPLEKGKSHGYVCASLKNAASDTKRRWRPNPARLEREFQQAVRDDRVADSDEGRAEFEVWYRSQHQKPCPKHASQLLTDGAPENSDRLRRLFSLIFADCIEQENPNAISILRYRKNMTEAEIIHFEKQRRHDDLQRGWQDPAGYGDSEYKFKKKYEAERSSWTSHRRAMVVEAIRSYSDAAEYSDLEMIFESMCDAIDKVRASAN